MREYGEFELIDRIREIFKTEGPVTGIGDDAAVIGNGTGKKMLLTTDALVEGVHFTPEITGYKDLGYKSMAVNMSDIAAMGGLPAYALLTLGIPGGTSGSALDSLLEGIRGILEKEHCSLVGGDTVRSPCLFISVTMAGYTDTRPIMRSGAAAGEHIYVTGTLGDSSIGFSILSGGLEYDVGDRDYFTMRHNRPDARVKEMQYLKSHYRIGAAIDISDGLLGDLEHIAFESGKGFRIDADKIPVSTDAIGPAFEKEREFFYEFAWSGGEDYEILFTSPDIIDADTVRRETGTGVSMIGEVTGEGREVYYSGKRLAWEKLKKGYVHF